ncbi:MAG TPA: GNAT family N-acetyltransferase [Methylomirabilota bacterium]|nr:GNAT family N-acetyltransferase [Methylomirabilota bacterium]
MKSPSIVIEPARAADAAAVIALIGRVFAEYDFSWDPSAEVPDLFDLEGHYGGTAGAFWVARVDGRVVGSVGVARLPDGRAELHRLYLDATLRGRGVGRALVEMVIGWCRAVGIDRLVLWSDTRFDRAHRLYEGMGFTRTGERELPDDPNDTREFGYERPV